MTNRKATSRAGRRPGIDECLEAWWRIADKPAGRILPDQPHGKPGNAVRLCNAFDLYCWRLVSEALSACKTRNIPPTRLAALITHVQCGGKFRDFRLYDVVQIDPSDAKGWRSTSRPINEIDRLGVDEAWVARAAYAKFRAGLQVLIDKAEPYIPPARIEMA